MGFLKQIINAEIDMFIKSELRNEYRLIRRSLDNSFCDSASKKICESIIGLSEYGSSKTIMSYSAINKEVRTDLLNEHALNSQKTLLLPVCNTKTETMHAARLNGAQDMALGGYGIYEPSDKTTFDEEKIDIVIVPALVFNRRGYRIGYGKGYYDKFLRSCKNALKIGCAYTCQISDMDFCSDYDIAVDIIVTQKEVIYCHGKSI